MTQGVDLRWLDRTAGDIKQLVEAGGAEAASLIGTYINDAREVAGRQQFKLWLAQHGNFGMSRVGMLRLRRSAKNRTEDESEIRL